MIAFFKFHLAAIRQGSFAFLVAAAPAVALHLNVHPIAGWLYQLCYLVFHFYDVNNPHRTVLGELNIPEALATRLKQEGFKRRIFATSSEDFEAYCDFNGDIYLSKGMINLPEEQTHAVICHEAKHSISVDLKRGQFVKVATQGLVGVIALCYVDPVDGFVPVRYLWIALGAITVDALFHRFGKAGFLSAIHTLLIAVATAMAVELVFLFDWHWAAIIVVIAIPLRKAFTRSQEFEADAFSAKLLGPEPSIALLSQMLSAGKEDYEPTDEHPALEDRIARLKSMR